MSGAAVRRRRRPVWPDEWTRALIAQRVRRLRVAHGETLREAADRCGVSAPTYMRWEHGGHGYRLVLRVIATGYDVPVRWLEGEHDPATDMLVAIRRVEHLVGPGDLLYRLHWAMSIG